MSEAQQPSEEPLSPYAPPTAPVTRRPRRSRRRGPELATPLSRLGAHLLDAIIQLAIAVPLILAFDLMDGFLGQSDLAATLVTTGLMLGTYVLVNGYFLATRGQSLGKMIAGVRIVRKEDGQLASVASVIGIRLILVNLLYAVPLLGPVFSLVDALFIFQSDRRCIHDIWAGTKVVVARAAVPTGDEEDQPEEDQQEEEQ